MYSVIKLLLLLILSLIPASLVFSQSVEKKEEEGFKQILTEQKLEDWDGNSEYWKFEEEILVGEVTEETPLEQSAFYTWDKMLKNFELKVCYRISRNGNSGIYYRSTSSANSIKKILFGYQADIDGANKYSGIIYENYENRGHQNLANRGEVIYVSKDDIPIEIGSIGKSEKLASKINNGGWNEYHLVVRGHTIIQILNEQVMSILIDDYRRRVEKGILGVQLHHGPPMKVEFRNFRFKKLPNSK